MNNVIVLISILVLSFILTYFVRKWAIKKSMIDHPNDRSSHSIPTPRGGGIAITLAWLIGLVYFRINNQIEINLFLALLSGLPLAIIGFLDDLLSLKPGIRFLIQFICAALALFFLSGLQVFDIGFWKFEFAWILTPIALIGIVWAINLFNFLDGIDGYISAEVIFLGIVAFFLFHDIIALLLVASVLGFLFWNWQKAKIFMGDVGSTLLGFNVAILAIYYQNTETSTLIFWIILTSVFWFDATMTLFRRIMNKENLSQAHRKHAFQRIVQSGFSHQKTVLWAFTLNLVLFGLAYLSYVYPGYSIPLLLISIVMLYVVLKRIDRKKAFDYSNIQEK